LPVPPDCNFLRIFGVCGLCYYTSLMGKYENKAKNEKEKAQKDQTKTRPTGHYLQ